MLTKIYFQLEQFLKIFSDLPLMMTKHMNDFVAKNPLEMCQKSILCSSSFALDSPMKSLSFELGLLDCCAS